MNDSKTGYKKPPPDHQFQTGQSGNPQGRKPEPAPKTFHELFREEAESKTRISLSGQEKQISKKELILERLLRDALNGDMRKAKKLLDLVEKPPKAEEPKVVFHYVDLSRTSGTEYGL